ncbi:substrate-binding domain-containing protein [Streptomyces bacillaris]|uniref:substrate-binding domain-containing protein n=1 Tax=Streptomyces bacillaris TaxID=68179 RepID=UPI0036460142
MELDRLHRACRLPLAHDLLEAAYQAELAVREQARSGRITIGYVEDLVITDAVRELRRRHPDAEIATRHLNCRDIGALSDKGVDALIARVPLPLASGEVSAAPLYEEPRMLVVPRGHPLAHRTPVTVEELAGEEEAPCPFETADWASSRLLGVGVPPAENYEDKLELVGSGRATAVLPVGDRRSSRRPDLTTVPDRGCSPQPGRPRQPQGRPEPDDQRSPTGCCGHPSGR